MFTFIQNFDTSIMYKVQELRTPILNSIFIFFTKLGDAGFLFILLGILFLLIKKFRKIGFLILLAELINLVIVSVLKDVIQRPRPFNTLANLHPLVSAGSYSFPSGHASSAFVCAVIIAYYFKKLAIPAYLIAILIAFSRVYVGVHYPSDIIVGALIGILCAYLCILFYNKILQKKFIHILKKFKLEY